MLVLEIIIEYIVFGCLCVAMVLLQGIFDRLVRTFFYCLAGCENPLWSI